MLKALITITTLALFVWLCVFAWHQHPPVHSESQGDFVARKLAEYNPKMVYIWRDKKAAAIASVWNLTPDALDGAADIYGRRR